MNQNTENRRRGGGGSKSSTMSRPHPTDNNNNNAMEVETAPMVVMVKCGACGHDVPEWNLAIHQARACPGNSPRVPLTTNPHRHEDHESEQHYATNTTATNDESMDMKDTSFTQSNQSNRYQDIAATATAPIEPTASTTISANDTTATPGVPIAASAPPTVIDLTSPDGDDQWTCQKCTLFNDLSDRFCAACGARCPRVSRRRRPRSDLEDDDDDDFVEIDNDDDCRRADPIRREQLLPSSNAPTSSFFDTSSSSMVAAAPPSPVIVGGGALVGGMLGAAGAYLRGRNVSSAMLEGAVTGAVGAAVAQQAWQQTTPPRSRSTRTTAAAVAPDRIAAARSSATLGYPVYPSVGSAATTNHDHNPAQPRSSMRVVTHVSRNGTTRTTYVQQGSNGTTRTSRRNGSNANNNNDDDADALLAAVQQFLAFSPLLMGPNVQIRHPMNIDGMSYDQLLEAFGDGTEGRRGASEATIHSLPTQVLQQDPSEEWSKNPELQTCSICLEPYQKGQTRKCLPCLHGFHQDCIDTWLRSNASCPICKHELS